MDFWLNWLLLVTVFSFAVVSPGPDFVIAVRNSVLHSRKIGVLTAVGIALGVCVHIFYTMIGIAALISQSVILFSIIKYAGAAYLIYIGFKSLTSKGHENGDGIKMPTLKPLSALQALQNGFLTNLLNPKATMFFLAVFSQFITPETTAAVQVTYGLTCVIMTCLWFSLVAVVLTDKRIKAMFLNISKWIDRISGGILIALGVRLAMVRSAS